MNLSDESVVTLMLLARKSVQVDRGSLMAVLEDKFGFRFTDFYPMVGPPGRFVLIGTPDRGSLPAVISYLGEQGFTVDDISD